VLAVPVGRRTDDTPQEGAKCEQEKKEPNTTGRRDLSQSDVCEPKNPYGGGPSTGLQFPPYYKPTPSVRSRMNYFPGSETIGPDEMRISFVGSCPFPLVYRGS
jgi:hypothetical protein